MNTLKRLASLVLALGCTLALASAQSRTGSIYNPDHGPVGLVGNKIARMPGDLITVQISESQDLKNEEKTDLAKSTDLNYELLNFNIKPNAFSTLPGLQGGTTDNFAGNAKYEKKGTFKARLAAIVMDTLPNGNLVIKGRREIRLDDEIKVIEFSGVVRRFDILPDNTIQSELVADARVSYTGNGPLTKSTNRTGISGWFRDVLAWIWPF